jgi:carboxypeptidase C (cathepsin A)
LGWQTRLPVSAAPIKLAIGTDHRRFNRGIAMHLPALMVAGLGLALSSAPTAAALQDGCAGDIIAARQKQGVFGGKTVRYAACVERYEARDEKGMAVASLTAVSYVAAKAKAVRPIIFAFNGGPISASAILHMGALGPKRVAVPDDVTAPASTYRVVDNVHSPLDVADIVFFDPAGTGLSVLAPGVDPRSQFSIAADARQLQQLVLGWTRAHGREDSPIYLLGESYGTLRAPAAAEQLASAGRPPAGVILLGQAVNIIEYAQRPGNIISYAVSLPTLAAAAWWHGKADRRGRDFDTFMADARAFGGGDYLAALYAGGTAAAGQQQAVADELAAFTGIPAAEWLERRLRMTKTDYQRRLFPGERLATNDARYRGPANGPDPFKPVVDSYQSGLMTYLRDELGVESDGYVASSPLVKDLETWDWGVSKTPFGDWPYARAITGLMKAQPGFRLFVGNGYHDTQTTVGAMDYLLSQNDWPAARVRSGYYQGGHMAYSVESSLIRFNDDLRTMLTGQW